VERLPGIAVQPPPAAHASGAAELHLAVDCDPRRSSHGQQCSSFTIGRGLGNAFAAVAGSAKVWIQLLELQRPVSHFRHVIAAIVEPDKRCAENVGDVLLIKRAARRL
jgi:hypothetical protein